MSKSALGFMVRAFRYPNYRLFFGGQILSLIGTWMTTTASAWLVYRLTGSPLMLGLVSAAGQFPSFLLTPVAGVFIDRWDKRRLLVITQTLSLIQSLALALLTLSGHITIFWIITLSVIQALINAFDLPCRQAFAVVLIENKEDLGNAIALNSSMMNAARLMGPALAGFLISWKGEGWCFLVDAMSFFFVIAALLMMTLKQEIHKPSQDMNALKQLKEGWKYATGFAPIRSIIILLALVCFFGAPYGTLFPIFAGQILHGGAHTLGLLMAATGTGSLFAALWLASRKSVIGLGRTIPLSTALFSVTLMIFAFSRHIGLSILLLVITGFGTMAQVASSNTILQTIVDDDKRGRVMSFFIMSFLGTMPIGSLLAGFMAGRIGAQWTLFGGGLLCLMGAGWYARQLPSLRKAVRPIYVKMGIIPEVATGLQQASRLTSPSKD